MKFDKEGVRKRRKTRLHSITLMDSTTPSVTERSSFPTSSKSPLTLQLLGAILLFAIAFFLFQSNAAWTTSAKSFTQEVMTRDFNFEGVTAWVKDKIGQYPSLLPTIIFRDDENKAVTVFSTPLKGVVVQDFLSNGTGVIVESGINAEVHPIAPGLVKYVGKTKDTGTTVIIQHAGGKESIYGFLGNVSVRKDDWVYPDRVIGVVDRSSLYLQVKSGAELVDPLDVISFD